MFSAARPEDAGDGIEATYVSDTPINQHALLSDCGAAALVTSDGSVDWLCLPRFDGAPVFARLLDDEAGHFSIAPRDAEQVGSRCYRPSGLVLDTTWELPTGTVVLTEAMALGRHDRGHELGRSAPRVLLRMIRCSRGSVTMSVEYAPRPEFGLVHPRLSVEAGAVLAHGGSTIVVLSTELDMDIDRASASAVVTVAEGQELGFAVAQCDAWGPRPPVWSARDIRRGLATTEKAWRSWSELHQRYEGPYRDLVHHSGVVLQALTHARTGAMVAAATTSLPEGIGSGRTWDYRFTWVGMRA